MIVLEGVAERWQLVEEPPAPIALLLFKPVKWQSPWKSQVSMSFQN